MPSKRSKRGVLKRRAMRAARRTLRRTKRKKTNVGKKTGRVAPFEEERKLFMHQNRACDHVFNKIISMIEIFTARMPCYHKGVQLIEYVNSVVADRVEAMGRSRHTHNKRKRKRPG